MNQSTTPALQEIHASYETNRREATDELLHLVAAAMRSVPGTQVNRHAMVNHRLIRSGFM